MKYIRTKDGRIISYNENCNDEDLPTILYYPHLILKEADTIPELCDGFYIDVCEPIFEKNFIYSKEEYYDFHYMITQCLKENDVKYKAYGFIKTSKGLIFVSELKDKDMVLI